MTRMRGGNQHPSAAMVSAETALKAAIDDDWRLATQVVQNLYNAVGWKGVMSAVQIWCDTLIHETIPEDQLASLERRRKIQFMSRDINTGLDGIMRPQTRWAMSIIQTRAWWDSEEFMKTANQLDSLKSDALRGEFILEVLRCVTLTLKQAGNQIDMAGFRFGEAPA